MRLPSLVLAVAVLSLLSQSAAAADPGRLQFTATSQDVPESAGQVTLTVSRTGGSAGTVAVMYSGDGNKTASAGSDYAPVTGVLTWADGDAADKTFTVPVVNDSAREGREAFAMKLSNPQGGARLGTAIETVYIDDDDGGPGTLEFKLSSQEVAEPNGQVVLTVSRTGGATGPVSVMYSGNGASSASAGADFEPVTGELAWADGDAGDKTFVVPIVDDNAKENREAFSMKLANPTGGAVLGRATETIYIADNETAPGILQFAAASQEVRETAGKVAIVVSRSGGTSGAVAVMYSGDGGGTASAGADFEPVSGVLSWGDGDGADRTVLVPIVDDTSAEPRESFVMKLSNVQGGALLGTRKLNTTYIVDDERALADADHDGVADAGDNCPSTANASQIDVDGDGTGDACDLTPGCPAPGTHTVAAWSARVDASAVVSSAMHSVPFSLPGGCNIQSATVQVLWQNRAEDLDLSVTQGSASYPSQRTNALDGPSEEVALAAPSGDFTADVSGFTNAGTDYRGRIRVTVGAPTECQAAFPATAPAAAATGPGMPFGQPTTLILSFTSGNARDAARAALLAGRLLGDADKARLHGFRHLPMLTLPVPAVTPELVDGLKAALRAYGLVSVWHDARIPLLNDQATAYTRVLEQRRDPALGFTGRGIGVAVIDSGVDGTQGDFANLRYNAKIVEGLAAVETPDSDTSSGHGTHVAGIIGGTGRMSGGQFAGVAPEATLLGFGSGDGDSIITLNALYAYDQIIDPDFQQRYNVRVTNNSYGGNPGPFDPADPIAIATKEAYDAGIVSVFAAGNAGPGANTMAPYALNPCVISAANGNTRGLLAGSSSRGSPSDPRSVPDITAPGTFITSTRAKTGTVAPPNRDYPAYATISGTSMASPHVAGIVALLLQANPALNFEQVLDILKSTATPMQDEHGTPYQAYEVGAGYVNALAAVQKAVAQPYAVDGVRVAQLSPGTPLEWHGYSGISLAPHGNLIVCLGCDTSGEKFPFVLPAVAGGYATLTVRLDYATPAEKLRLVVTDPSGASQASSVDGTASQQVTFVNPKPGRWTPAFFEELTATTSYRLTVTAVCAVAGCPANAPDADGDGVPDLSDNCPNDANPGQSDVDGDGIGDACDVPETACASPGLTLWRDPANDDTPPLPTAANGAGDILSLNVAEPADQFGKLVFTLKVRSLASLPPNVQWYVIFNGPPKSGYALGKWHVEMQTDETGTPTFSYGRYNTTNTGISEGPGAGDVPSDTAVAGSTYDAATGTITLVVDKSTFGDEGAALAGITANVYQLVGAFGAGSLQTIDAGGTGGYTLRAASACDVVAPDQDGDGWLNEQDNCPTVANADQADLDGDGQGDACDGDLDGDGVANAADAFPADPSESVDTDNDGIGNNADTDDDGDGIADAQDPCPLVPGDACGPIDTGARAVVAVIDSAFNPYHSFFYEGSAIYPAGSPPHAVTPALLAELGVDAAHQLQVTRTGNMATDLAADAALWATVKKGELYWFKGTNVLAISFAGSDGGTPAQPFPPLKPVWYPPASDGTDDPRSKNPHGTGTSSAVLKANPDAAIVFVETDGDLGNNAAHEWVRDQAAVDMFSTSYGVQLVAVGTLPETRSFHQVYEAVVQKGKMHFAAAGNNPGLTPLTGGAGPWWSIGVGGVEEDNYDVVRNDYTGSGQQVMAGNFPDFVGDYTQQLPYCLGGRYDATGVYAASGPVDCEAMINDNTPGTSFSTPRAAGVASRVLLEARRALGHAGGITTVDGVPVLAAGNGKVITNWFLRRALEQAAWIPPVTDRSTGNYITWEFTNVPVNPVAPWLQVGWGELTANPAKGVVSAAMAHLGLGGTPRDKGTGFCEFQTELVLERHTYWDSVAPNVPLSYTSNDGRTAHSGADPFIYCASLNPTHPPSNDPGGQ